MKHHPDTIAVVMRAEQISEFAKIVNPSIPKKRKENANIAKNVVFPTDPIIRHATFFEKIKLFFK